MCYKYDVELTPEIANDNSTLKSQVLSQARPLIEKDLGKVYFSGLSVYSLHQLNESQMKNLEKVINIEKVSVDKQYFSLRIRLVS